MDLEPIANENKTIEFELLSDDRLSWDRSIFGRLSITDRFLSTYHKPLQRRMLYTKVNDTLPLSGVFRVKSTGEIYLLGQSRFDVKEGGAYDRLSVAHLVSNESGGLVPIYNYLVDGAKPVDDRAELVKTKLADLHIAIEYLSTSEHKSTYDDYYGKYLVFSSHSSGMVKGCTFTFSNKQYQVIESHIDSDFTVSICVSKPDIVQSMIYKSVTASTYNPLTSLMVINHRDYKFTGELAITSDTADADTFHIYPNADVYPFMFRQGDYISTPDFDLKIVAITDVRESNQRKLVCEPGLAL